MSTSDDTNMTTITVESGENNSASDEVGAKQFAINLRTAYLDSWTVLNESTGERTVKTTLTQTEISSIVLNEITKIYNVLVSLVDTMDILNTNLNTLNTNHTTLLNSTQSAFTNVKSSLTNLTTEISQTNTSLQTNVQALSRQIAESNKSVNSVINNITKSFDKQIQRLQENITVRK